MAPVPAARRHGHLRGELRHRRVGDRHADQHGDSEYRRARDTDLENNTDDDTDTLVPATATPTATPSAIATPSPTVTPSPSATPTLTPTSTGTPALAVLDIDGNGETDALTDGLLVLYWLFGFSGDELPAEAIEQPCTRCDASAIESYLESIETQLDIDSNGATSPLTDGVLVMRFLSGFTHGALTAGAVDEGCTTRCEAEAIEAYLQTLI